MARYPAWLGPATALALGALTAGCAKKEAPSGGPPDIEPPRWIAAAPESGAAGVAREARPSITFSEAMEPRSTNEAVALAPRVDIKQWRWAGRTLTVVLAESLRARQTYTLFVGSGARDRHGNPLKAGATIVFTTAPAMPPGVLEGEITARGFAAAGTYLWCYDADRNGQPDSTARDFDALGLADADGRFRVVGLPVPGRYRLWAFADLNRNRSFEPGTDLLVPADTTLGLTTDRPAARGLTLTVVNPRAPGKVRGTVLDSAAVGEVSAAILAVSERDSTQRVFAAVNDRGEFDLQLEPGVWILRAFRDLDRNRGWSRAKEPLGPALRLEVSPASDLTGARLELPAPPAPQEPARKEGDGP
jgi:hypothetical protein